MTGESITAIIHDHLTSYSAMMVGHINSKFYDRAITELEICKELLIILRYVKEHEVNK